MFLRLLSGDKVLARVKIGYCRNNAENERLVIIANSSCYGQCI